MANTDGTESFTKDMVGLAKLVYEDTVGDMDYLFVEVFIFFYDLNVLGNVIQNNMLITSSWTK